MSSPPVAGRAWTLTLALALPLVLAAAALAVVFPLGTYTVSLAVLGLPHVLAELRYVDARFRPRAGRGLLVALGLLLAGVVAVRAAGLAGLASAATLSRLELGLVVLLAATTVPAVARRGPGPLACALGVVAALAAGAVLGSAATLVLLALLHNLTPVGFLAERLRGRARAGALAACAVVFGLVPALIASGLLHGALDAWLRLDATPLASAGPLERSLGVFVPAPLLDSPWAIPLFSAAAFLQVMHHATVLHVLPALDDGATWARPRALVAWPRPALLLAGVALAGLALLPLFVLDFVLARRVYGLAAAVHAWLEVPVLLLALVPDVAPAPAARAPIEAASLPGVGAAW